MQRAHSIVATGLDLTLMVATSISNTKQNDKPYSILMWAIRPISHGSHSHLHSHSHSHSLIEVQLFLSRCFLLTNKRFAGKDRGRREKSSLIREGHETIRKRGRKGGAIIKVQRGMGTSSQRLNMTLVGSSSSCLSLRFTTSDRAVSCWICTWLLLVGTIHTHNPRLPFSFSLSLSPPSLLSQIYVPGNH